MHSAKVLKETEKAIQVTFKCEVFMAQLTVKSAWLPKSQLNIDSIKDGIMNFTPKNAWIMDEKVKDYLKFLAEVRGGEEHLCREFQLMLSPASGQGVIDDCWYFA